MPTEFTGPRFYEAEVIAYELTESGDGFEVTFRREEREVTILSVIDGKARRFSAKAHPEDQYDEQFGFELAAARLWQVPLDTPQRVTAFIHFRAYVWGRKGWGKIDLTKVELGARWPQLVETLLERSKAGVKILVEYSKTGRLSKAVGSPQAWLQRARQVTGWEAVEIRVPVHGDYYLSDSANVLPADSLYTPSEPRVIVRRRGEGYEISGTSTGRLYSAGSNITDGLKPILKPKYFRPAESPTCSEKSRSPIQLAEPTLEQLEQKVARFAKDESLDVKKIYDLVEREKLRIVDFRKPKFGEKFVTDYQTIRTADAPGGWPFVRPIVVLVETPAPVVSPDTVAKPVPHNFSAQEQEWIAEDARVWRPNRTEREQRKALYDFLHKENLRVVARRMAQNGELFIQQHFTPQLWKQGSSETDVAWGKRLIVEKRS